MKAYLLSLVCVSIASIGLAQTKTPQTFNYQGVVRKSNGMPIGNKTISFRLSILNGDQTEYFEIRKITTNSLGMYNVQVGSAGAVSTSTTPFNQIDWSAGSKSLKVELDLDGGESWTIGGISPIAAAPYAIFSEKGGTSGYNTWAAKPENAGKSQDAYLIKIKDDAIAQLKEKAADLTPDSEIDGLLTIDNGTGALLKAASIKIHKGAFDEASQSAVAAGLAVDPANATAAQKAMQNAVSTSTANALTADPANATPAQKAIQDAISNSTANALTADPANATPAQKAIQDAISTSTANALSATPPSDAQKAIQESLNNSLADGITTAINNPAAATPAQQAMADAIKAAAGSATEGTGGLTSDNNSNAGDQVIEVLNGDKSAFKDIVLSVNKTNLQNSVAEGMMNADGSPGSNTALQNAISNSTANALAVDPANATPAQKAIQDAISNSTANALTADPANATPAQKAIQDAISTSTANALSATPPSDAQKAIQESLNNSLADGITTAINNPAAATPAQQAMADAIKAAAGSATEGTGGLTSDNNSKAGDQVIEVLNGDKSAFKDIVLSVNKTNLQNSVAEGMMNADGSPGSNTALQNAISNSTANALTVDPAKATPAQKAIQDAISTSTANALSATPPSDAQKAIQESLNNSLADGITTAINNPAAATPAQQAMADAIKAAAGSTTEGAGGITSNDNSTTGTSIIEVQNGDKSIFKDVVLAINKNNLQTVIAEGFNDPNNTAMRDAMQDNVEASKIKNKKDITSTDLEVANGVGAVTSDADVVLNIKPQAITLEKINPGTSDQVMITNKDGMVEWKNAQDIKGAFVDGNTISGTGLITDPIKVGDEGVTDVQLAPNAVITTKIADNAITTAKILDQNITTEKIADNAITTAKVTDQNITTEKIADNAVTTAKILDANVTTAKIAAGTANQVMVTDAAGAVAWMDKSALAAALADGATIDGDGTAANPFKIMDLGVTTAKIADANITTAKILDQNITTEKVADNAVTTAKILDANITTAKIAAGTANQVLGTNAAGAVAWMDKSASVVADGATIDGDGTAANPFKIMDLGVTTAKIADANITTEKILDQNITAEKIADNAVTTAKILDANITTAKIAAGTANQVLGTNAAGAVAWMDKSASVVADGATIDGDGTAANPFKIMDLGVTTAKIIDNAVTTAKIADVNVTTAKIADNAITTAKIIDQNITTEKVADNAVTTAKILDANVTTAKIAAGTANQVLGTNAAGAVAWMDKSASVVADGATIDGDGTAANPFKIKDLGVTTAKIADANITTEKILDQNITAEKIADNAVTTAKILDANVTTAKIAAGTANQVLVTNDAGTATEWADLAAKTNLAGDVTGTANANKVEKIQNIGVLATAPTANQVLQYDGTNWKPSTIATPFFTAGAADIIYTNVANNGKNFIVNAASSTATGAKMMFIPAKNAFRAGSVAGTQWDAANIGNFSVALGQNSTASGLNAFAAGNGNVASGANSVTIGLTNKASGVGAITFGSSNTASANLATAIGNSTTASAVNATAIGVSSIASGANATAIGNSTAANGDASTAIGNNTIANGTSASALGVRTTAFSFGEFVVGISNTDYVPGNTDFINSTDRLFVIGNGTSTAAKSDAMVVLKNGNTGLGISTPTTKLDINNGTTAGAIKIVDGTQGMGKVLTSDANGLGKWADPAAGTVLAGDVTGTANANKVEKIQNIGVLATAPTANQVLQYNGTAWAPSTIATPFFTAGAADIVYTNVANNGKNFVVNSASSTATGFKMMFLPAKGAFRAGAVTATQWDAANIGNFSVAFGQNNTASTTGSIAAGSSNTASGDNSISFGLNNTASGSASIAMGNTNVASGLSATAIGFFNTASGNGATAFGLKTFALSYAETVVGQWNTDYTPLNTTSWNVADRLFVIGNGNSATLRSDAMVVLKSGNTGLGTSTPTTKLDINNGTTAGAIKIVDGTQGVGKVLTSDANGLATWKDKTADVVVQNASFSLQNSDNGKIIYITAAAGNVTVTVPNNLPIGFNACIIQKTGLAVVTFGGTFSNVYGETRIAGQHGTAFITTPEVGYNVLSGETR